MGQPDWETREMKALFQTLLRLKNEKEMATFMRDIATISELRELSLRWEAAKKIDQKVPYRTIAKSTGLSTATISRIAFWLNNGEGGYRSALRDEATNNKK
ncbi:MAG TPA: YerC/YecD family TrpR-related protein [Candidatus Gracilibacteria bacterium]